MIIIIIIRLRTKTLLDRDTKDEASSIWSSSYENVIYAWLLTELDK